MTKKADQALGMDEGITRRDFLNSTLIASGAALLSSAAPGELLGQTKDDDWNGYGGVGDYANSNGNTQAVVNAGHEIRDKVYKGLPADTVETGEIYDCVIVGGGISGLAAALLLQQQTAGKMKSLVLENHAIFGGEARRNEFEVDGQRLAAHQGSAMFWTPFPYSFIGRFYDSIGLKPPELKYQTWEGSDPEFALPLSPYDIADRKRYGFYFPAKAGEKSGTWVIDPWAKKLEGAPIPTKAKAELLAMWAAEGKDQRPKYPGDAISRHLDSVTIEQHLMETYGLSRETIRAYLSDEGSGSGLGPDALSAYSDYAADFLYPMDDSGQMFPGGNTGIARMITKTLIPDAIAGEASVDGVARGAVNFAGARSRGSDDADSAELDGGLGGARGSAGEVGVCDGRVYARRQDLSSEGALGDDGWRLLDDEAYCARPSGGAARSLRAVLSVAVPDGECGSAELAIPLQQGDCRMPLVWRVGQLHECAADGDVWAATSHDQSGFADGADDQTHLFVSGDADGTAGSAGTVRNAGHAVCRI